MLGWALSISALLAAVGCGKTAQTPAPNAVVVPAPSSRADAPTDVPRDYPVAIDWSRVPPRPRLPVEDADTNDAMAYLRYGLAVLDTARYTEGTASDAFYWAARLNPSLATANYARWLAVKTAIGQSRIQPNGHIRLLVLSPANQARLDSLKIRALFANPFVNDRQEYRLWARLAGRVESGKIFGGHDPGNQGVIAYANGDFARAAQEWGIALKKHPKIVLMRLARAHALYYIQQADSAIAELASAEEIFAQRDSSTTVPVYVSREMIAYAVGFIELERNRLDAARAAFQRALEENVGFYAAHEQLAAIAFSQHDTATALTEYETALEIQPGDPVIRVNYAFILDITHRGDDAEAQLRESVRLDPDYALPYWLWGQLLDSKHDSAGAVREYKEYLARAADTAQYRAAAATRVSALVR